jgi:hypothetical protein
MEVIPQKTGSLSLAVPGAIRIICPGCGKKFKSHLGNGWVVSWCKKCNRLFKTSNEAFPQSTCLCESCPLLDIKNVSDKIESMNK